VRIAREKVLPAASVLFGAMWLAAAGAKVSSPLVAYELVAHVVPVGPGARAALAAAVLAEVVVGVSMVTLAVRGFWASLVGLVVASGFLLVVRASASELVPCGCFGDLLGTTLDGALVRNAVLGAAHFGLILWSRDKPSA
jgi:hypothetical protein